MEPIHVIVPAMTSYNSYYVSTQMPTSQTMPDNHPNTNTASHLTQNTRFCHPSTPPLFTQKNNTSNESITTSITTATTTSTTTNNKNNNNTSEDTKTRGVTSIIDDFPERRVFQELQPVQTSTYSNLYTSSPSERTGEITLSYQSKPSEDDQQTTTNSKKCGQPKLLMREKVWAHHHQDIDTGDDNDIDGNNRDDNDDFDDSRDGQDKTTPDENCTSQSKESQVVTTLKWLSENYELSEGVCLPRCVLYLHYLDFCKRQGLKPSGAATFGKLIRQKFKNITTRRLGTRGQSKYHYYGIGIKETSIYYQSVYTGKGLTRFSGIKIKTEGSTRKYSLSAKTGTLLPEFPNAKNLIIPDEEISDKMTTFIMMYRTHSQRILDTVITANFEEIQNLLLHFWQGYPQHLLDVLRLPVTTDVIAICDSILYKVLTDVLVPNTIQDFPDSLSSDLKSFLRRFPKWLQNSLDDFVPDSVKQIKNKAMQGFLRCIKRQLAFVRMAQTARSHLTNSEVANQAVKDLQSLDLHQISVQTRFALNDMDIVRGEVVTHVFEDYKGMLEKQTQVEGVIEWLDNFVDTHVLQGQSVTSKFRQRAGPFLLQWTMFGALIMKDLTLNNAKSFSFIHLMKLTMDEYVFLVLETQADKIQDAALKKNLQKHMKNAEEITMNATVRNQSGRSHASPKAKKRKTDDSDRNDERNGTHDNSERVTDVYHEEQQPSLRTPPPTPPAPLPPHPPHQPHQPHPTMVMMNSNVQPMTAFVTPHASSSTQRYAPLDTPIVSSSSEEPFFQSIATPTSKLTADSLCPPPIPPIPPQNIPISPMKYYYPSNDRCPYIPSIGFNAYTDYINNHRHHHHHHHHHHTNNFPNTRPPAATAVHPSFHEHTSIQTPPFQTAGLSTAVAVAPPQPAAPPTYWTDSRLPHHNSFPEPYAQFPYNTYQDSYDPYRKRLSPLLRSSVYHQDTIACTNTNLDGFQRGGFDSLSFPGSGLDNLPRHSLGLDGLSRPGVSVPKYDNHRSGMSYYGRTRDNYTVNYSLPMGSIGQGRIDVAAPPGGQYPKQDGLFYHAEEALSTNMAVNSTLPGFGKSYFSTPFR